MAARPKVLIDLNFILDVLQKRDPFYDASTSVLACAETGHVEGLVAAHSLTTLFCLVARGQSAQAARVLITQLLQILSVASVGQAAIEQALSLPDSDFEDAVQMIAALQADCSYLVTRAPQDFKAGPLPALQPAELLALV